MRKVAVCIAALSLIVALHAVSQKREGYAVAKNILAESEKINLIPAPLNGTPEIILHKKNWY